MAYYPTVDNFYLAAIVAEIAPQLSGRTLSRISLSGAEFRFAFGPGSDRVLVASLEPSSPAMYLSSPGSKPADSDNRSTNSFL
ncbi:MAG TPA: hypothetical protein VG778_08915, partial [Blastocatellia bacterium]|nr:hypothetical protein [Blastocatellia bacterium]